MRIEQGYAIEYDRQTGQVFKKFSVFSCAHCGRKVQTRTLRSHHFSVCRNCDDGKGRGLICDSAECNAQCRPFMRAIEEMEARARFRCMI